MVKIYGFGPAPGLPDLSPFVIKAMTLLKMAGVEYAVDTSGFRRAPKGKLPYIDDGGVIVADSTFIRFHLEKTRGIDFDVALSPVERAQSVAIEALCEDHLMWIIALHRWKDEENFARGPGPVFDRLLPPPVRRIGKLAIRRGLLWRFWQQGVGRFTPEELAVLGARDIAALATLLGDKPFLFGDQPRAADASAFGMLAVLMDPATHSPTRGAALSKANLLLYRERMMTRYFAE